jgi:hypothetical protein
MLTIMGKLRQATQQILTDPRLALLESVLTMVESQL